MSVKDRRELEDEIKGALAKAGIEICDVYIDKNYIHVVLADCLESRDIPGSELLKIVAIVSEKVNGIKDWFITLEYTIGDEDELDYAALHLVLERMKGVERREG